MSPSGVYYSFMVLPSLDIIYQLGLGVAIAMLPSNIVYILWLSGFQGNRVGEYNPRSGFHGTGVKLQFTFTHRWGM